jgi:flagellar FliJ protein
MPVFKFRLQSIYDLRVHVENEQKDIYASENESLRELTEKKQNLEQMFDQWSQNYMNQTESGISATECSMIQCYLENLKDLMKRTDQQVEVQQQIVENARLNLVEKMKDRKTLENLKERQYNLFREEMLRKDEKDIEETLSANLFLRD